jgi:GxxExxY protein
MTARYDTIDSNQERFARQIVDSAFCVHRQLGPGLLESVYEACFVYELMKRGLRCMRQTTIPIVYENLHFEEGFRLDVMVEDLIICELKAIETLQPVHIAQLLTYLRLSNRRLGFLINFNVRLIKQGIKRVIR